MKKVPSKHAELVKQVFLDLLKPAKDHTFTITSDIGKEFVYHQQISNRLDTAFNSTHLCQSWQQGLNEHTN